MRGLDSSAGMDRVAERMLGRLEGRAAPVPGSRLLARMEDRAARTAGRARSGLLHRFEERGDLGARVELPWAEFSVRPMLGAGSWSGDAVTWLEWQEEPEIVEDVAQFGESTTRVVRSWGDEPAAGAASRRGAGPVRPPPRSLPVRRAPAIPRTRPAGRGVLRSAPEGVPPRRTVSPMVRAQGRSGPSAGAGRALREASSAERGVRAARLAAAADLVEQLAPAEAAAVAAAWMTAASGPAWRERGAAGRPSVAEARVAQVRGLRASSVRPGATRAGRPPGDPVGVRARSGRAALGRPSARAPSPSADDPGPGAAFAPELLDFAERGAGGPDLGPLAIEGPLARAWRLERGVALDRAAESDEPRSLVPRAIRIADARVDTDAPARGSTRDRRAVADPTVWVRPSVEVDEAAPAQTWGESTTRTARAWGDAQAGAGRPGRNEPSSAPDARGGAIRGPSTAMVPGAVVTPRARSGEGGGAGSAAPAESVGRPALAARVGVASVAAERVGDDVGGRRGVAPVRRVAARGGLAMSNAGFTTEREDASARGVSAAAGTRVGSIDRVIERWVTPEPSIAVVGAPTRGAGRGRGAWLATRSEAGAASAGGAASGPAVFVSGTLRAAAVEAAPDGGGAEAIIDRARGGAGDLPTRDAARRAGDAGSTATPGARGGGVTRAAARGEARADGAAALDDRTGDPRGGPAGRSERGALAPAERFGGAGPGVIDDAADATRHLAHVLRREEPGGGPVRAQRTDLGAGAPAMVADASARSRAPLSVGMPASGFVLPRLAGRDEMASSEGRAAVPPTEAGAAEAAQAPTPLQRAGARAAQGTLGPSEIGSGARSGARPAAAAVNRADRVAAAERESAPQAGDAAATGGDAVAPPGRARPLQLADRGVASAGRWRQVLLGGELVWARTATVAMEPESRGAAFGGTAPRVVRWDGTFGDPPPAAPAAPGGEDASQPRRRRGSRRPISSAASRLGAGDLGVSVARAAVPSWSADRREQGQMAGFAPRVARAPSTVDLAWLAPDLVADGVGAEESGGPRRRVEAVDVEGTGGPTRGADTAGRVEVVRTQAGREPSGGADGRSAGPIRVARAAVGDAEETGAGRATRAPRTGTAPEVVLPRGASRDPEQFEEPTLSSDGPFAPFAAAGAAAPSAVFARTSAGGAAGLLGRALSRAWTPVEVVQAVAANAEGVEALAAVLPEPAARALREVAAMRTLPDEAARLLSPDAEASEAARQERGGAAPEGSSWRGARRVRGAGGSSGGSASSVDGAGASRLMRLSQKLMSLIHLAEVENRAAEAQRQVRRSDEKVDASATGGGGKPDGVDGVTLASLQREVLEMVQRELEMIRERGEGGRHGDFWW